LSDLDAISVEVTLTGEPVEVTLTSIGADDGLIVESSETSETGGIIQSTLGNAVALWAGDLNNDAQAKSIVSFDTSVIPVDATVLSATLRLRRGNVGGTNPFVTHGDCLVDAQSGGFSGDPALESSDFEAPASATAVAVLSNAAADGDWSEGVLNASGLSALNLSGITQFRVHFQLQDNDDGSRDFISYRSGDDSDPANHPQLIVVYQ